MNELGTTVVGVLVLILTACFDALGYNIQRRDHCKNALSPKPRHECFRKYWHLGLYIYIASLVLGNTIAMNLVKAHWVAPITTSSLIFNVIFARVLVGSKITKRDIVGTAVIVTAIGSILLLTSISNSDEDVEINLDIDALSELFTKFTFIIYFAILNGVLLLGFLVYLYLARALHYPNRSIKVPTIISREDPKILAKNLAILISILGGIGASETVILAKSGVTYLNSAFQGNWPFFQPAAASVVFGLGLSAAFQLFCLNAGLKLADSVLVGPIFSSVYNVFALFNTLVFLEKFKIYPAWVLFLMIVSVGILVVGIIFLASQLKPNPERLPKLPRLKCTPKKNKSLHCPLSSKDSEFTLPPA